MSSSPLKHSKMQLGRSKRSKHENHARITSHPAPEVTEALSAKRGPQQARPGQHSSAKCFHLLWAPEKSQGLLVVLREVSGDGSRKGGGLGKQASEGRAVPRSRLPQKGASSQRIALAENPAHVPARVTQGHYGSLRSALQQAERPPPGPTGPV